MGISTYNLSCTESPRGSWAPKEHSLKHLKSRLGNLTEGGELKLKVTNQYHEKRAYTVTVKTSGDYKWERTDGGRTLFRKFIELCSSISVIGTSLRKLGLADYQFGKVSSKDFSDAVTEFHEPTKKQRYIGGGVAGRSSTSNAKPSVITISTSNGVVRTLPSNTQAGYQPETQSLAHSSEYADLAFSEPPTYEEATQTRNSPPNYTEVAAPNEISCPTSTIAPLKTKEDGVLEVETGMPKKGQPQAGTDAKRGAKATQNNANRKSINRSQRSREQHATNKLLMAASSNRLKRYNGAFSGRASAPSKSIPLPTPRKTAVEVGFYCMARNDEPLSKAVGRIFNIDMYQGACNANGFSSVEQFANYLKSQTYKVLLYDEHNNLVLREDQEVYEDETEKVIEEINRLLSDAKNWYLAPKAKMSE